MRNNTELLETETSWCQMPCFKAVLRQDGDGTYQAITFVFKNDSSRQPLKDVLVSVDSLESLIGYDLFLILMIR